MPDEPLFDPARHEPLHAEPWSPGRAADAIEKIVAATHAAADADGLWSPHPQDDPQDGAPFANLYFGAPGVIWALDHLAGRGFGPSARRFADRLESIRVLNNEWLARQGWQNRSFLMGDAGILFTHWRLTGETGQLDALAGIIAANTDDSSLELMWGAPGTMLCALALWRETGEWRWVDLFLAGADALEAALAFDPDIGAWLWTQDLYGSSRQYLGPVHGFAGNAWALISGRELLAPDAWSRWSARIAETLVATARRGAAGVNWAPVAGPRPATLVQHCHGAPGMVTALSLLPEPIDEFLIGGGELTWIAGPLRKGANLCHGTGGNGYAFLKLFERTGNQLWLDRARAFAMHAIAQSEAEAATLGQRRHSLWTGDPGLAIYLADCLEAKAGFPTVDVL